MGQGGEDAPGLEGFTDAVQGRTQVNPTQSG